MKKQARKNIDNISCKSPFYAAKDVFLRNINMLFFRCKSIFFDKAKKQITIFKNSKYPLSFRPFLMTQGIVVLLLFVTAASFFIPHQKVNQEVVIKDAITKQLTVVIPEGDSVQRAVLVKRSNINSEQYLLKLPKSARNIKIKNITAKQAKELLKTKPEQQLSLKQKATLAKANQPKSFFVASLIDSISKFFFASLEEGVSQVVEQITQPDDLEVTSAPDADYVDLSAQITEQPVEESKQEQQEQKEEKKEEKQEAKDASDEKEQGKQDEDKDEDKKEKDEAQTALQPEVSAETPEESVLPETPDESLAQDSTIDDTSTDAENTEEILPIDESEILPEPETEPVELDEDAEADANAEAEEEYVEVDYETPAPTITEEETNTGKLVTVSSDAEKIACESLNPNKEENQISLILKSSTAGLSNVFLNFFSAIEKFLFADLEQAASQVIEMIAGPAEPIINITPDPEVEQPSLEEITSNDIPVEEAPTDSEIILEGEDSPDSEESEAEEETPVQITEPLLESADNPSESPQTPVETLTTVDDTAYQECLSQQVPLTDVLAFTSVPEIYKIGQEDKIKIKWRNNGNQNVTFSAYDTNGNGKLDYVEWTVPHLSDQIFEIIFITGAMELDQDMNPVNDIYEFTKEKDGVWTTIPVGHYVRATFQQVLDNTKDNTIYVKPTETGSSFTIEVYPVYTDEDGNQTEGPLVATFENIDHEGIYKVLLTDLQAPTDTFDLKVLSNDLNASIDVDWIVDPSWYNASWLYRKKLTFDNSSQAENLTDFTILVKLTSSNFDFSKAQSAGQDIRFIDSDDSTPLSYEIESWDNSGQTAAVWVEVAQVDSSSNTDFIYMYYGNAAASDAEDATATWSNNYEAVWHFNETTGNYTDSSGNSHSSDAVSVTARNNSCIGNCPSFNGTSQYISVPDSDGFDLHDYTISAYVKCAGAGTTASSGTGGTNVYPIIAKGRGEAETTAADVQIFFGFTTTPAVSADFENDRNAPNNGTSQNAPVTGATTLTCNNTTFYHVAERIDTTNDTFRVYYNGAQDGTVTTTYWPSTTGTMKVGIGTSLTTAGVTGGFWNGVIDELRVEKTVRSAYWIAAQSLSINNTFITYAAEEGVPPSSSISSAANQIFSKSDPVTAISTITVTDASDSPTITATNDIRIKIPATFNMTWDETDTTATIGGAASAKVSTTVSYEDTNKTLVLNVTENFAASDAITVAGLSFKSFSAASASDNLELEVDNAGTTAATDDKTIVIAAPTISSAANKIFIVGDSATAISTITITESATAPAINTTDDIRIKIPTAFNMTWDETDTTATIGGTASAKASTTVSYEDSNKTLVVSVTSNFSASETLTISGLSFKSFSDSSADDNLELEVNNQDVSADEDDKTIMISSASWLSGWSYRKQLTFDNSAQAENLTNFSVLVKLTSSNFDFAKAQSAGQDIRFVDSAGYPFLSYEIESWDNSGQTAYIWVKVPQINSSSNTDSIYMYYGNGSIADGQDATNVWDSNFKGVWHFDEDPSGAAPQLQDSTSNNLDGTSNGSMLTGASVAGQASNALDLDGSNDYISFGALGAITDRTVEMWINGESWAITGTYENSLYAFNTSAGGNTDIVRIDTSGNVGFYNAATMTVESNSSISTGGWHYFALVTDAGSTSTVYQDGASVGSTASWSPSVGATDVLFVGQEIDTATPSDFFNGKIDEVRVSTTIRSASWIAAQYKSVGNTFITFGSEINSSNATISSAANQSFTIGDSATAISTITITDNSSSPTITATNDIRIKIPATFNMTWDETDTTATIGGAASAKVSTTVSYEDTNKTLVLNVTENFAASDAITVSGLSFKSFSDASASDNLELEVDNAGTTAATDDKTITVAGPTITLTASTSAPSGFLSDTDGQYFGTFKLAGSGAITGLVLTEYGTADADADLSNVKLIQDNGNGTWSSVDDTTQLGSTTNFNSSNEATFSGFSIAAGDTSYIHVISDVDPSILPLPAATIAIEILQDTDVTSASTISAASWPLQLGTSTLSTIFPYLQSVTTTSIEVSWMDSSSSDGRVDYGLTSAYGSNVATEDVVTSGSYNYHKINITGLTAGTTYHYQVTSNGVTSADNTFTTAPADGGTFNFVILGDQAGNANSPETAFWTNAQTACESIVSDSNNPKTIVLQTGDHTNNGAENEYQPQFFLPCRNLFKNTVLYNTYGNHDTGNSTIFGNYFDPPTVGGSGSELYYSFNYGNTHFIVLNGNASLADPSTQRTWVASDLATAAATGATWRIAIIHQPPYSYNSGDAEHQDLTDNVLAPGGVDLVIGGHNHFYQRLFKPLGTRNGMMFIVEARGGATMATPTTGTYLEENYNSDFGYTLIEVGSKRMRALSYNTSNTLIANAYIPHAGSVSSGANQTFSENDSSTAISTITITDNSYFATFTAANDIRIKIPDSLNMTWDETDTTATIGGADSAKVSTTVSYENSNKTLVLNVTSDFGVSDVITVSGLSFKSFSAPSSATNLELITAGASGVTATIDDKTITINGVAPTQTISSVGGDSSSPYSTTDTTPLIALTLNENGDCYASESDESYDDMSNDVNCTGDGTTSISCQMGTLADSAAKTIYISCKDTLGTKDTSSTNTAVTMQIDSTAPTTAADAGSYTFNTWTNASVTSTLLCADGSGAGCLLTLYCTDTVNSCTPTTPYATGISVSTSGTSYIRYYSTDSLSNQETAKSQTVKIDTGNPTVDAGADQSKGSAFTQTGSATDSVSGVASYLWSKVSGSGTVTFGSASAAATTISADADGTYVIRLTATDNANNSASDDITLTWASTETASTEEIRSGGEASSAPAQASADSGAETGSNTTPTSNQNTSIIDSIAQQFQNVVNILNPNNGQSQISYPPIEESVPVITPESLQGLDLLSINPLGELNLSLIQPDVEFLVERLPQFEDALSVLGVDTNKPESIEKLSQIELYLPGLTQTVASPETLQANGFADSGVQGVPLAQLSSEAISKIPNNIVFAKTSGGYVDLSFGIKVDKEGNVEQEIKSITGKPLELIVKPDSPASKVIGLLTLKETQSTEDNESKDIFVRLFKAALSAINPTPLVKDYVSGLLVQKFEYVETMPGIFSANINAPLVEGKYEVITVVEYKDKSLSPTEMKFTTVIDPEGYVYRQMADGRLRVKNATVSIYWLNPETEEYEMWPADKFLQKNPIITDESGKYSFLVPQGTYYMSATAPGYYDYRSDEFVVKENNGIHMDIELKKQTFLPEWFGWGATISILLVVLIVLIVVLMLLIIKKGRDQLGIRKK